jgi:hypothetical protein
MGIARWSNDDPLERVLEVLEAILAYPMITISRRITDIQVFKTFGELRATKLTVVVLPPLSEHPVVLLR